jgi:putative zinc finger/helix-turn-helix YgiT family protein
MATKCPICGREALENRRGKYSFDPPPNIPGGAIVIDDAQWEECTACGERIASVELEQSLENERYSRLGLLRPEVIKEIRSRAGLSQEEMAEKIGVGRKTYARWESGHSLHNTSSDNLIRLFARDAGLFEQLDAERNPDRQEQLRLYIEGLEKIKGGNELAIAAHGGELNSIQQTVIHSLLMDILKRRRKG